MHSNKLQEKKLKHIGVVAVSAPGAALCYQTIIAEPEKIRGITAVYPPDKEKQRINEIIYAELVKGICTQKSTTEIIRIIAESNVRGADAVILACTELPLVLNDTNAPLPTIDTTRLLAQNAVENRSRLFYQPITKLCSSIIL